MKLLSSALNVEMNFNTSSSTIVEVQLRIS